jgi:hypothetical protein
MKTDPVKEILPRENDEYLQTCLDSCSDTLDEAVNFGTHILKWDVEIKREGTDYSVPSIFFRNVLELCDGISILLRKSSVDPSIILLRSLFENYLSIKYLLEKDEDIRGHSFMVWKVKNDIKYYKQFISDSPSNKELAAKTKKDYLSLNLEKFYDRENIISTIESKKDILQSDKFKAIAIEFERTKKKIRKNPTWYSLFDGPQNIQALSEHFGKYLEYEFLYRKYSQNVHVQSVSKAFSFVGEDKAQIIQIRDFESLPSVFSSTNNYMISAFNEMILKRIPEKRPKFLNWYSGYKILKQEVQANCNYKYEK